MVKKGLTIGYTCNVRPSNVDGDPRFGEWESSETIDAVTRAFEKTGNQVILIDADPDAYHKLMRLKPELDIVFNNAEGLNEVQIREAIVPTFCEFLGIPYSGSGPQTLINALDKPTTKEILNNYGIPTPPFQTMESYTDRLEKHLDFPLMVKPTSEGTSIGISQKSRVKNADELEVQVRKIIKEYRQPALVEEFIHGDEYTVGIIGKYIFPILKVPFQDIPGKPLVRDPQVKNIENPFIQLMSYNERGYRFLAKATAIAFDALACNDYCRMDWREKDGIFYFLEMNPLPGIHPKEADLTNMAVNAGITHHEMMNLILFEALKRNRRDRRFSDRFTEDRIAGINEIGQSVRQKLELYDAKIQDGDYRLVRRADLG
jgi:D-alanine-D-alanine ligase